MYLSCISLNDVFLPIPTLPQKRPQLHCTSTEAKHFFFDNAENVHKCAMDIDLYADVEDFNSDDAVPNPEDADPKPKNKGDENGGDDIDLYDDVIASSSSAAAAATASEDKKDGDEAKPEAKGGDAYQRPGRKYQVSAKHGQERPSDR